VKSTPLRRGSVRFVIENRDTNGRSLVVWRVNAAVGCLQRPGEQSDRASSSGRIEHQRGTTVSKIMFILAKRKTLVSLLNSRIIV